MRPAEALTQAIRPAEALTQAIAERVTELVVQALDVNGLLARVDVDALVERVDVDALLARVDVDLLLSRVDVDSLIQRVDVDRLIAKTDIGSVIARSSGGVASGAMDAARSQAVGLDEFIARLAAKIWRRSYPGPPGPPELLRQPAPS